MVSVTVGSGGDYANWSTFQVAINAASPLGDDWEATQISSFTSPIASPHTVDLNGYNLTLKNLSPHGGDPTAGYKVTCSGQYGLRLSATGAGTFEAKDLNFGASSNNGIVSLHAVNGATGLFHGILAAGAGAGIRVAVGSSLGTGATVYAWDIAASDSTGEVFKVSNNADANTVVVESCSAFGSALYGFSLGGEAITIRNCVAGDNGDNDFHNVAGATGRNNASEDNTATTGWSAQSGGHTGIVPATEFESTDPTASTYMKITNAGVLYDGGTTTTVAGNTAGIRGDQRPQGNGDFSVGVDEFPSPSIVGGGAGSGGGLSGAITAAMAMGY